MGQVVPVEQVKPWTAAEDRCRAAVGKQSAAVNFWITLIQVVGEAD